MDAPHRGRFLEGGYHINNLKDIDSRFVGAEDSPLEESLPAGEAKVTNVIAPSYLHISPTIV